MTRDFSGVVAEICFHVLPAECDAMVVRALRHWAVLVIHTVPGGRDVNTKKTWAASRFGWHPSQPYSAQAGPSLESGVNLEPIGEECPE